jgi:hypothetical protein
VNSSISQSCVGDIFSEKEVGEQKMWKCEMVKGWEM